MIAHPLNVLVVHGIGEQPDTFADEFERVLSGHVRRLIGELTARYRLSDPPSPRVLNVIPGLWAPVPEGIFKVLESRLFAGRADRMRALAMRFMGDVIAYQGPAVYEEIHRALAHALRSRLSPESRHLTIVAHSLGTVIASDFVHDHTRRAGTRFRDHFGVDFVNFFTLGSPLALYAARSPLSVMDGDGSVRVLDGFDAPVRVESERGVWVNVYSDDDVVGYPLKHVNDAYARAVTADVVHDAGNLLTRWNLFSHGAYWTEPDVITMIAEKLAIDYAEAHLGLRSPALDEALAGYRGRLAPVKRDERAGSKVQGPRT
ncbi:MAG TPA: hypothetical protein VFN94_08670 [Nitrospiria bacterium]|nr:hypothetical protein [Nitrospiria bacterium]